MVTHPSLLCLVSRSGLPFTFPLTFLQAVYLIRPLSKNIYLSENRVKTLSLLHHTVMCNNLFRIQQQTH